MKLLIVLNEDNGINSRLGFHFGRSPFFGIYDTNSKELKIIKNIIDHSKNQTPVDQINSLGIDMVYTQGMGRKAYDLFQNKDVILKTGNYETLKEVIDNIDNLKDLKEENAH